MKLSLASSCGAVCLLMLTGPIRADDAGVAFFEARIRPVLVEHCYECHNSQDKTEGGLALDDRAGLLEGGDSGPALVPGKPDEGLLLKALRHAKGAPRMPKRSSQLSDAVIADFVRWVRLGAPDPRDKPPAAEELRALTSWESIRDLRKQWWSFQPVTRPALPEVRLRDWSDHPIDRFILAKLEHSGFEPAAPADRRTWIRRVSFGLTGLPPTPAEVEQFVNDPAPRAEETLVDRLLRSPRFGERWARHWMDWLRFAESHGSEGDPAIPYAWRYRDYLIRALNDDVPYDRLVREHLAGDLLPDPRINRELQINESALGTAHYRMVPHGFAPTDALDEQVTFTDNQIDVLSKAFLGLTVSCARCHNHKFDPISQTDFYAFYGIMASCRPALITVDTPERAHAHRAELEHLRGALQPKLADAWTRALADLPARLQTVDESAAKDPGQPLHAWAVLRKQSGDGFASTWKRLQGDWARLEEPQAAPPLRWDLRGDDYARWFHHGNGLPAAPSPPGAFSLLAEGDRVVSNVYPAGAYTHLLSNKHNGVLTSPRFPITTDAVSVRVAGGNKARARLVVQNYPRVTGLIYSAYEPDHEAARWQRWDTRYWKGDWAHVEIATAGDLPVEAVATDGRSWFGIMEVVGHDSGWQPRAAAPPATFVAGKPGSPEELAALYVATLSEALKAWGHPSMTDEQAEFLGGFVRAGLLPNTRDVLPELVPLIAEYRKVEADVPIPTRAPGVLEGTVFDQPLFVRGNHKQPGAAVPRRFLEAFGATPYSANRSGRLELAEDIVGPRNPLTARVHVNRLWHHLFGRGLVPTVDNLGRLGDPPTHPELLDFLAARFVDEGWSIKRMVRFIVTSKTYQANSQSSKDAAERDPTNLLLAHFPVRRLEAEAIRDAILATTGQLDETRDGPSVSGQSKRRSVYVRVQRNSLDPFLNVFDAPEPMTARGRRDSTNVPAQSLTLLNDPWVIEQARRWAEAVAREPSLTEDRQRIAHMLTTALGRPPSTDDLKQCRQFLADQDAERERDHRERERLGTAIAAHRRRIAERTAPVRERLAAQFKSEGRRAGPEPIARWEFDGDLRDGLGTLHGQPQGDARLEGGALVLDGNGSVQTAPLTRPLTEKTLEAWVVLDDLDQRGGGVLGVETIGGQVFDAIVFGELTPREWLAGSNFYQRTQPLGGPPESEAVERPVHVALAYQRDGTISGYRDGKPYGKAYKSDGPIRFEPGTSHVVFGLRHSPAGGNKMLKGKVLKARLYDRALTAEEVAASGGALPGFVPESAVLADLPAPERAEVVRWNGAIAALTAEQKRFETSGDALPGPVRRWQDLAHAILNFKEFLYVR